MVYITALYGAELSVRLYEFIFITLYSGKFVAGKVL